MLRFSSSGILVYYNDYCVAYVDKEIARYYLSLIPKYYYVQPQAYPPHITIVRRRIEVPPNQEYWRKYHGQSIDIQYEPGIKTDGTYFFLDAYSNDVSKIRKELGLPQYRDGFKCYYITVGNIK